jgi:hypothetical protein
MQSRGAFAATLERPARLAGRLVDAAGQILVESVRRHRAFIVLVLAYSASCFVAAWLTGNHEVVDVRPYSELFSLILLMLLVVAILGGVFYVMIFVRPAGSLYPAIGEFLFRRMLSTDRVANMLIPFIVGPIFFNAFGSFKRLIPLMNPYGWDHQFMIWDTWLHGGIQPWELLQPILGTPIVTSGINLFYNFWLILMLGTFIWQACSLQRPALRMQYLLSFLAFWAVIGTALATVLSSAGPCYYARVTGLPDPYQPLMDYLRQANEVAPIWSLKVQEALWQNYESNGKMLGGGISAMPSMHLAMATLMALLGWRINRWAGAGYTAFAAIILVGSVHLGWHYAIDGYVSIVAAIVLWCAVGWTMRRFGFADDAPRAWSPVES